MHLKSKMLYWWFNNITNVHVTNLVKESANITTSHKSQIYPHFSPTLSEKRHRPGASQNAQCRFRCEMIRIVGHSPPCNSPTYLCWVFYITYLYPVQKLLTFALVLNTLSLLLFIFHHLSSSLLFYWYFDIN